MHRTRLVVAGLITAIVLLASLPGSFVGAEGDSAEVVSSLPSVPPSDAWLGLVQAIQAPDLAFQAGARWDRVIFPWSLIQKNGPKSWEQMYFSDAAIRAQVERGVTMVGLIIYTPQWASTNPTYGRPIDRPQGLNLAYNDQRNTWGQFVRQLAIRQRGVVDNWIIWNEPDVFDPKVRYTWDGSYEEYFQLLKTAYLNIKEVNPQARVILGGLSYWWDKKYARTSYLESLLQVIERDPDNRRNGAYFDAVTLHVYNAPLNWYAVPLITRQTLEAHGLTKPIWIDESNAVPFGDPASPLPYSPMAATLDQQAAYVIQSTALALAAGVERYAIYKAVDEKPENGSDLYGLVRNDHSLKPAYLAYQVAAAYFQDVQSATYSWPGSAEVPTPAEVQSILDSADSHPQFIWPAQVSQVVLDRGPHLTTVLWNNSPFDVTHSVPANARQATLVTRSGATETITARGGFYKVELPGSRHNPDKSDYSIYMIGGDPFILDEQVAPLPSGRVRSRIEKVWPHESAPVETATQVNITAQLLLPGPAADPVPCRYKPEQVQLWRRLNGGPPELVANGVRRLVEEPGLRYPVWDFNDVNVERARAPESSYEFYILVDGLQTDRESWIYGGPESTDWTQPPVRPPDSCE